MIAAVFTAAVLYVLWNNGCFLPQWAKWQSGSFYDKSEEYGILLDHRAVEITYHDEVIWNSPKGVKVQEAISCDIDHDQEDELILLCWKRGRYGKYRPFWVDRDEQKWSQHIFVYEYEKEEIRPKWMSSYIGVDVVSMSIRSRTDLRNSLLLTDTMGNVSSWAWDFWGFSKEDTEVSFAVFGDNLIHEPIYRYGLNQSGSFHFLFENVESMIRESDISVINQETPLVDDPSMYGDYPRFGTPIEVGQAITDAGFDVVTCATNHALDRGAEGINITKEFFESHQILCLGIQSEDKGEYRPYETITRKGIKFALLNYTYGTNGIRIPEENINMVHTLDSEEKIRNDLEKAREEADFVIVFVHWGTENSEEIDDFQKKWTQIFLDSQVDVVIGTHPHILQPYEMIESEDGHEMLVYYSIGNFVSAQPEKTCIKGGIASFTVSLAATGYEITDYGLQPLTIFWQEGGKYTAGP